MSTNPAGGLRSLPADVVMGVLLAGATFGVLASVGMPVPLILVPMVAVASIVAWRRGWHTAAACAIAGPFVAVLPWLIGPHGDELPLSIAQLLVFALAAVASVVVGHAAHAARTPVTRPEPPPGTTSAGRSMAGGDGSVVGDPPASERVEVLGRMADAEEIERRSISRSLHDSAGQHLTALSLGLKALEANGGDARTHREHLAGLRCATVALEDEIDRLADRLRPVALDDLGLHAALHQYATTWSRETGLRADVHIGPMDHARLSARTETAAYRIVQEAMTNVHRHARASCVNVLVEDRNGELRIVVEDDGRGFDPALRVGETGELGLLGMAERATCVSGTLQVESRRGEGTTVYLSVPTH